MEHYGIVNGERVLLNSAQSEELETWYAAEQLERPAHNLASLRAERDAMLKETDWWVLPDRTPTQEQLDYRQALRDITNTYTSLDDVIWPEKP